VIAQLGAKNLVIGGKTMGGRIASMVADEAGVAGLICLGYPFHPVGKPERLRVEHLRGLKTPALIVQGDRDPFGSKSDVGAYGLSEAVQVHWLPDGVLVQRFLIARTVYMPPTKKCAGQELSFWASPGVPAYYCLRDDEQHVLSEARSTTAGETAVASGYAARRSVTIGRWS